MTEYETGFAVGERDAFEQRRAGQPMRRLEAPASAYQRGYRDGYTPRSSWWWARNHGEGWKHHEDAERAKFARDFVSMAKGQPA